MKVRITFPQLSRRQTPQLSLHPSRAENTMKTSLIKVPRPLVGLLLAPALAVGLAVGPLGMAPAAAEETHLTIASAAYGATRKLEVQINKTDRKSTRLNSSHVKISYAVFCLQKEE